MPYELNFEKKKQGKEISPIITTEERTQRERVGYIIRMLLIINPVKEGRPLQQPCRTPPIVGINDILHKYGVSYPFE